jgi:hypothetical protein
LAKVFPLLAQHEKCFFPFFFSLALIPVVLGMAEIVGPFFCQNYCEDVECGL